VKKSSIARYTAEQLAEKRRRGESRSNWRKAASTKRHALEKSIAADPDEAGMVVDWRNASVDLPQPKAVLNMRVDREVLNFFRKTGSGYQTRINAVLRAYVRANESRPRKFTR
jgi:uncharacterized protein (DUF4415 family)